MHKFIAIGDVHADFVTLWAALRAASCVDAYGQPTLPVQQGLYQVVIIGDLVHPKTAGEYARLIGQASYDPSNPDQLFAAAREQVRELEKLMAYQQAAPHAVHILLGNHDDAALRCNYLLGTVGGLSHIEFDPKRGGVHLPAHLQQWFASFPRELRAGRVQFAHVGPLPAFSHYDDLFYADSAPKQWWQATPEYVMMADLAFGVYGHTQMRGGIHLDEAQRLAMIDALSEREYLELMLDLSRSEPVLSARVLPF